MKRSFSLSRVKFLAAVLVEFPPSTLSVFVRDYERLRISHGIRPFAIGAVESVHGRGVNSGVEGNLSCSWSATHFDLYATNPAPRTTGQKYSAGIAATSHCNGGMKSLMKPLQRRAVSRNDEPTNYSQRCRKRLL